MHTRFTTTIPAFIIMLVVAGALGVSAYNAPTAAPMMNNADAPIDTSATPQIKDGGLSVHAFTARGNAVLMQRAIFNGTVRGGTPQAPASTLTVAGTAHVTGTLRTNQYFQSTSLSHPNDSSEKPICATATGIIVICN